MDRGASDVFVRTSLLLTAVAALAAGCASKAGFLRPTSAAPATITDEATGRTWNDCRAAFAASTEDVVVLTFSEGVHRCGAELPLASDFVILRGAGLGRTFLDAGPGGPPRLTTIRPRRQLRVEDLAFGGLTELPTDDAKATLVRVAIATDRPALFGDPRHGVVGSILVAHSLLAAQDALATPPAQPRPLSFQGNERIAVIESLLVDVEQEFERYPAPGSVVLLSEGLEAAFSAHQPGEKERRQASTRPNVPCGHGRNPIVSCASAPAELDPETSPVVAAAEAWRDGAPLAALEPLLRAAARDFTSRFVATLGPAIRQPDVFWFDDALARVVEEEAALAGRDALTVLLRARAEPLVAQCGSADEPPKAVLARARALDRLLPNPTTFAACAEQLAPRRDRLLAACASDWDWDALLAKLDELDGALGQTGDAAAGASCRAKLRARLTGIAAPGPLARAYLARVDEQLALGGKSERAAADLRDLVSALPWIETRSGRSSPASQPPTVLDRLVRRAQVPDAANARKLVEVTPACVLVPTSAGSLQMKAIVQVQLAVEPTTPTPGVERVVAAEVPVEATKNDLPGGTPAGSVNMALVKTCEERTAAAYPVAVTRFVRRELERLAAEGPEAQRAEADVGLLLASLGEEVPPGGRSRRVPMVRSALESVAGELLRDDGMQRLASSAGAGTSLAPLAEPTAALMAEPAPPSWTMADFARAADVLSRAGQVNTDSCAFLLPQIAWRPGEAWVSGAVTLENTPALLRCRPDPKGYELSVWVDGPAEARLAVMKSLAAELGRRLGAPAAQTTRDGPAFEWSGGSGGRLGFLYRTPPAATMLGYVLVPLRSNWNVR